MQLPHVFIAFLAREVRFPHGFIAFSLFIFLGCPDGLQERFFEILVALWEPLGPSWGLLGVH